MHRREQRTIVDGVDFGSIFQFHCLFGAIKSSMQPARLIIGLGMVLVLLASGKLWDSIAEDDAIFFGDAGSTEILLQQRAFAIAQSATALGHIAPDVSEHWSVQAAQQHLIEAWRDMLFEGDVSDSERAEFNQIYFALEEVRPRGPFESSSMFVSKSWMRIVDAGLNLEPSEMWKGVVSIVWDLPQLLWKGGFHWFISLFGFLLIYVLCVGGGAIARMQACEYSRSLRVSIREAIDFSLFRWRSLLTAVVGPAMFIATITVMLMVMGLVLMNIPWLNLLGGLLYGIALLLGFLLAVIAVGYAICCPILIPAVVVEDCSGGEAIQRSFAYLLSRSIHFVAYLAVLIISLVLGYLVVRLIAHLTLDITSNVVGAWTFNNTLLNAGSSRGTLAPAIGVALHESAVGSVVGIWVMVVQNLIIGWIFSGFFSASTMLYLLMRKTCDGQDTKDIWWEGLIQGTNVPED